MLKQWIQKGIDEQDEQSEDMEEEDEDATRNSSGGGRISPLPIYTTRRRQAPADTTAPPSP